MLGHNFYFNHIEPHIPSWLHKTLASVWRRFRATAHHCLPEKVRTRCGAILDVVGERCFIWRTQPFVTKWLGPRWRRKGNVAEIDITYICNLKCFNCNRSCEQDPSNDSMSLGQIRRFLDETRDTKTQWKHIRLLGGEPTTHPQFLEILNLIKSYRDNFFPATRIVVVSNGHGDKVNRMLSLVPAGIEVENTAKTSKVQTHFQSFNVAPIDVPKFASSDFCNACRVVTTCGIGVTPYGYYPCAVAGSIDRTFGLNLGRKELPKPGDAMTEELRTFCRLCGLFKPGTTKELHGPVMSPTWEAAYDRSHSNPARLSRLPEAPELVEIKANRVA